MVNKIAALMVSRAKNTVVPLNCFQTLLKMISILREKLKSCFVIE